MSNLIQAELFKLKRNKSFWVIMGVTTGLSILLYYLVIIDWWMMQNTNFAEVGLSKLNALSPFTTLLFFNLIGSSLAAFFISVDFSVSGVIKNQIISGNKRAHIFLAKFLIYSFGAVMMTVVIPFALGVFMVILLGAGEILSGASFLYLGKAFLLFMLHFLSYTALMTILAIITEVSGKNDYSFYFTNNHFVCG